MPRYRHVSDRGGRSRPSVRLSIDEPRHPGASSEAEANLTWATSYTWHPSSRRSTTTARRRSRVTRSVGFGGPSTYRRSARSRIRSRVRPVVIATPSHSGRRNQHDRRNHDRRNQSRSVATTAATATSTSLVGSAVRYADQRRPMAKPELRLVKWGRSPSCTRTAFLWATSLQARTKRCRVCLESEREPTEWTSQSSTSPKT